MAEKSKKTTKKTTKKKKIALKTKKEPVLVEQVIKDINTELDATPNFSKDFKTEMRAEADKLAVAIQTKMKLDVQEELSSQQEFVANKISSGYSLQEAAKMERISVSVIEKWMKQFAFVKRLNELTFKEGVAEKGKRVQNTKRLVNELNDKVIAKILENELDNMSIDRLMNLLETQNKRLDALVDVEDKDVSKKDISVLIINHFKDEKKKNYNNLDDFINDPSFAYPQDTIDVEAELINNDE